MKPLSIAKRRQQFESRVEKVTESGCWVWMGGSYAAGYGGFSVGGLKDYCHRQSWRMYRGEIPAESLVLHKCDVKLCCNPDHLYIGDHRDNRYDRDRSLVNGRFMPGHRGINNLATESNG